MYRRVCLLVKKVYVLIGMLPSEERFALAEQMRRAVVSVKLNFKEGSGKRTSKEFAGYLDNSMGSLKEVGGCIEVGVDLGYFGKDEEKEIGEIRRIERLLAGYKEYVKKKNVK